MNRASGFMVTRANADSADGERDDLLDAIIETLRKRPATKLDGFEGDVIARAEAEQALLSLSPELLAEAERVFGDANRARSWLVAPLGLLGGVSPAELGSYAGAGGEAELRALLLRIEHGVFS